MTPTSIKVRLNRLLLQEQRRISEERRKLREDKSRDSNERMMAGVELHIREHDLEAVAWCIGQAEAAERQELDEIAKAAEAAV